MSEIIVGIDLGTTNSAVAIVQDGEPRLLGRGDEKIVPSVVAYSEQAGWLVGRPALNQYTLDPDNTVRSIKRDMGSDKRVTLGGRELRPQEISAFILRELKSIAEEALGESIEKAVLTVPAYFTNAQRQATKEAGAIAGLEVVRIINEPTAAALAYGLGDEEDQMALVYDLGGGTFDVSLVEMTGGVVEVRASHGDTRLGGDDFDMLLAEHAGKLFYKRHQFPLKENRVALARLRHAAEMAKIHMSDYPEADLREEYLAERDGTPLHLDAKVLRSEFEEMSDELLKRTVESMNKVLEDAELEVDDLSQVLLVGGSSRMPAVWQLVENFAQIEPAAEINPDEVVALGAAVQGAIIAGQPVDSILVDVTPYSLGIETATFMAGQIIPDIYSVLIHRNTTIPVTKEEIFYALHEKQDMVEIKVYQGEAAMASANTLLDDFFIKNLKPFKPGEAPSVNVRFDFDVNGMLNVTATDRLTGNTEAISVEATQSTLSLSEISEMRQQFSDADYFEDDEDAVIEGAIAPEIDDETQALLTRGKALLDEGKLADKQATSLKVLMEKVIAAATQDDLDELSEELLDVLFDLE
ncbi:Hsp70 family protein [Anaerolineales bacterium HSG6]|nr:Hsp70 family protein [Anaerolineales bacterium HSG6]MDM8532299.1 Hsp70 family protein [Anaerolineales bacterium HSG25]